MKKKQKIRPPKNQVTFIMGFFVQLNISRWWNHREFLRTLHGTDTWRKWDEIFPNFGTFDGQNINFSLGWASFSWRTAPTKMAISFPGLIWCCFQVLDVLLLLATSGASQEQLQCVARLGLLSQALLFEPWQRLVTSCHFCWENDLNDSPSPKDECRGTFENAQASLASKVVLKHLLFVFFHGESKQTKNASGQWGRRITLHGLGENGTSQRAGDPLHR